MLVKPEQAPLDKKSKSNKIQTVFLLDNYDKKATVIQFKTQKEVKLDNSDLPDFFLWPLKSDKTCDLYAVKFALSGPFIIACAHYKIPRLQTRQLPLWGNLGTLLKKIRYNI